MTCCPAAMSDAGVAPSTELGMQAIASKRKETERIVWVSFVRIEFGVIATYLYRSVREELQRWRRQDAVQGRITLYTL